MVSASELTKTRLGAWQHALEVFEVKELVDVVNESDLPRTHLKEFFSEAMAPESSRCFFIWT